MKQKEGKAVVQTPMKRNGNKKSNKGLVIGASTALVIALVGGVFYTAANNEEDAAQQQNKEQTTTEPVAQQQAPAEEPATPSQEAADDNAVDNDPQNSDSLAHIDATKYIENQPAATEPTYINGILLANKQYPLPQSYNPGVDPTAQKAMDDMIAAAKQENLSLTAFSGFRSYERQQELYSNYVARDGQENADRYSARPGYSEHQTGLSFDVGEVGNEELWLTEAFGETAAGQWLVNNAHQYGFILRYPKGKEHLTGFMYESWHFRYVGVEVATIIHEQDVTLEEYLGIYNEQPASIEPAEAADDEQEEPQVGAKTNHNN